MSKAWRNTIIVLVSIWLIFVGLGVWVHSQQDRIIEWALERAAATPGPERNASGSLPTPGICALRIRSTNGNIELRSTADSELRYEATLWGRGQDAQAQLDAMDAKAEVQGDTIIIESLHRSESVSNAGINYVIYVPQGLGIDISLVNGMVKGEALVASGYDFAVSVVNGAVDLRLGLSSGAEVVASVTNGKVSVNGDGVNLSDVTRSSKLYRALINGGGSNVKVTTVNGVVKLKLDNEGSTR